MKVFRRIASATAVEERDKPAKRPTQTACKFSKTGGLK